MPLTVVKILRGVSACRFLLPLWMFFHCRREFSDYRGNHRKKTVYVSLIFLFVDPRRGIGLVCVFFRWMPSSVIRYLWVASAHRFFIVGVNSFHCRRGFSYYRCNHRNKNCLRFLDFSFSASMAWNRTHGRLFRKNPVERCKLLRGVSAWHFLLSAWIVSELIRALEATNEQIRRNNFLSINVDEKLCE